MVLERLVDRTLGLAQRACFGGRRVRQRAADGVDQEGVRVLSQREGARFAAMADHAAGGPREPAEMLALAARRARGQLRRQSRGEQELETARAG